MVTIETKHQRSQFAIEITIAEIKFSSMWSLWSLGLQKWSSLMAAFARKQLRVIVTTTIAITGHCNYSGLRTFLYVGSDSYLVRKQPTFRDTTTGFPGK